MAELKPLFKRVRCRLTGGHRYRDEFLTSVHDPIGERFLFVNRCIKCGEFKSWYVPAESVFAEVNRRADNG